MKHGDFDVTTLLFFFSGETFLLCWQDHNYR